MSHQREAAITLAGFELFSIRLGTTITIVICSKHVHLRLRLYDLCRWKFDLSLQWTDLTLSNVSEFDIFLIT